MKLFEDINQGDEIYKIDINLNTNNCTKYKVVKIYEKQYNVFVSFLIKSDSGDERKLTVRLDSTFYNDNNNCIYATENVFALVQCIMRKNIQEIKKQIELLKELFK